MITDQRPYAESEEALGRVQFYLLWGILFINVTAGIGIPGAGVSHDAGFVSEDAAFEITGVVSLWYFQCGWTFVLGVLLRISSDAAIPMVFFAVQFVLFLFIPGFGGERKLGTF